MLGDDPEFIEAIRLAAKFFPESRCCLSPKTGFDWHIFLGAMMSAEYSADYSCDPLREPTDPDGGLARRGGLNGDDAEIYERLLQHTSIDPRGRAVVVPDGIGKTDFSVEECRPFVCHSHALPERLRESACFGQARDVIFVFETGSAILVDHDDRVHWAHSRTRQS